MTTSTSAASDDSHYYRSVVVSGQASAVIGNQYNNVRDIYLVLDQSIQKSLSTIRGRKRQRLIDGSTDVDLLGQILSSALQSNTIARPALKSTDSQPAVTSTSLPDGLEPTDSTKRPDQLSQDSIRHEPPQRISSSDLLPYVFPTALVTLLACRSLSVVPVLEAISQLSQDPLFSVISALTGWYLNTLYRTQTLHFRPTTSSDDESWFEDVYGKSRRLPPAYLEDPDIFRGFLKAHYRGTSAEKHVLAERYNLMIGSGYGELVTVETICSKNSLARSSSKLLTMAIMYRASFYTCLDCTNRLSLDVPGSFRCSYCRRSYRILTSSVMPSGMNTAVFLEPPPSTGKTLILDLTLGAMKNINLDIRWKICSIQPRNRTRITPKSVSASRPSFLLDRMFKSFRHAPPHSSIFGMQDKDSEARSHSGFPNQAFPSCRDNRPPARDFPIYDYFRDFVFRSAPQPKRLQLPETPRVRPVNHDRSVLELACGLRQRHAARDYLSVCDPSVRSLQASRTACSEM